MGETAPRGTLYVVVCAAPPAAHVQDLVKLAQAAGWEVAVTATPEALAFIDRRCLRPSRLPVRHRWREPDEPESVPEANAIVVAPATFNTINRWVAGITNTVAVGTLCESSASTPHRRRPNVNRRWRVTHLPTSLRQLREWACGCCSRIRPSRGSHAPVGGDPRGSQPGDEATGWHTRGAPGTGTAARVDGGAP